MLRMHQPSAAWKISPLQAFGAVVFSHLWGLRRVASTETANWKQGLPAEAQSQVAFWSRALLAHPVECRETFRVDGNTVRISDEFGYQTLTDAWGTEAMKLAPIPPVLALLTQHGFPSRVEPAVTPTGYATNGGPLACARGERVAYDLTLPCTDHFGLVATADPLPLQAEIDQMAEVGLKSTQFASGGYTSHTAFHDDMRLYDSSSGKTFDAPCIDLYKWLYCFPMLTGRPLYRPELRPRIDAHHRLHYWQAVNFYPHKCFVQWRREPWTGTDYVISFVWPVMFQDGVRWFANQNESAAVILYCLWAYSQYHGDWLTARSNWPLYRQIHDYLAKVHDWAFMASSNQEFFSTVGIDMLNSEYPGNLAAARVARQAGDADYADRCLYLAAKSMAPILARLYMRDYVATICPSDHPWREWKYFPSLHEGFLGGDKDMLMRGDTESVLALAIDFYDTSNGTSPEIELLYKHYAAQRITAYEADVQALADEHKQFPGWAHLMMRAMLGQDSNRLMELARGFCRTHVNWGWQTTKGPHNLGVVCLAPRRFVLTDWAPAEYLGGTLATDGSSVTLRFRSDAPFPCVLSSARLAESVRVNGREAEGRTWTCAPETGRMAIQLPAGRDLQVEVRFGRQAPSRLHPYFATAASDAK
ncbi:MAG: hypothetical protein FJ279_21075 [Planctomycetes bacterium]|nr:hypothetical protein [Planctomycetota bacterium]